MTRSVRAAFVLVLALSIAGLTACGGGGGRRVAAVAARYAADRSRGAARTRRPRAVRLKTLETKICRTGGNC